MSRAETWNGPKTRFPFAHRYLQRIQSRSMDKWLVHNIMFSCLQTSDCRRELDRCASRIRMRELTLPPMFAQSTAALHSNCKRMLAISGRVPRMPHHVVGAGLQFLAAPSHHVDATILFVSILFPSLVLFIADKLHSNNQAISIKTKKKKMLKIAN